MPDYYYDSFSVILRVIKVFMIKIGTTNIKTIYEEMVIGLVGVIMITIIGLFLFGFINKQI